MRREPTARPSAPESSLNIIRAENLGNLGLSDQEVKDVVAFLHTLTDGWTGE